MEKHLRVLLVGGSEDDTLMILRAIRKGGYNLIHERVETIMAVQKALDEKSWDMVLCHYILPRSDCRDAITLLRELDSDLPLMIICDAIDEETAVECLRLGANDYILKSNLSRLVPAIERELKARVGRSEKRLAEKVLLESEERFRHISQTISDFAYSCSKGPNEDYSIDWITGAFESITGYSSEEILGWGCWKEMVFEEDLPLFLERVTGLSPGGLSVCELRIRQKEGGIRWLKTYNKTLRDQNDPSVLHLYGACQDITVSKRMEEELRESESKYRLLYDSMRDAFASVDMSGRILDCNDTFEALLGYSKEELSQLTYSDLTPERWHSFEAGLFKNQVLTRGYSEIYEKEYRRKDGSIFPVELHTFLLKNDEGQPIGMWAIVRDISERKKVENELLRLILAIEQSAETIVITDTQGTIQYVNPAFTAITGYTSTEAVGQNPRILKSGLQEEAFYRELWRTIAGGRTWQGRLINRKKNGAFYTEEATISPVYNNSGVIINYVAVKRDITEQIRLVKEREKLQSQFLQAQKMESVGRLASGVAHDFNNMLGVILGRTELAMFQLNPSEPLYPVLEEIYKAARRSGDLTRRLLAFARKQIIMPQVLDLNDTVEGMLMMLRRLIGEDIDLKWLPGSDLWPVKVDPSQIDQILANLSVNSRDAITGVGKITIQTENVIVDESLSAEHVGLNPGPYVKLTVSDDGHGMNKETLTHLFEPFFTTKDEGRGTGLGLATVYGIVKQNNGFINVYSEPGEGTTITIYLPSVAGETFQTPASGAAEPLKGFGETILLVDDEEMVLNIGKKMLEKLGYTVLAAWSPTEALHLAQEHLTEVDLLITDVVLPEMNGQFLAEQISRIKPDIKCLFMSGYTYDLIVHSGMPAEGLRFIQKPFLMNDLALKVRQILDQN
jgi:two-component system cell cycle sensor histidine kinase/response regulator CckA